MKIFELKNGYLGIQTWELTKLDRTNFNWSYVKLYDFINGKMEFKGLGIFKSIEK